MKTLYIHIGTPKTGTTAIQAFLAENTDALFRNNYIFRFFPFRYTRSVGAIPPKRNGFFLHGDTVPDDPEQNRKKNEPRLKEGLELIAKWFEEKDNVILSDEFIWNEIQRWDFLSVTKQHAKDHGYIVKLIVFLRPQSEYIDSFYRQRTKMADTTMFWEEYLNSSDIITDYYGHLSNLAGLFGKENIVVRPYEPRQWSIDQSDIFHVFMDTIDAPYTDDYVLPPGEKNLSVKYNDSEIKRVLNYLHTESTKAQNDADLFFRRKAKECSVLLPDQEAFSFFSEEERSSYMSRFEEGNNRIAKEYLGRDVLFAGAGKPKVKWDRFHPTMQDDIILFFGNVTEELFREINTLKKENEELKRFSLLYRFRNWLRRLRGKH